ncbi:Stk1 family PASTA domain-containing Ser/Thr kinase [Calidifontibacter indicus]|uniref:Stk1 family PASTA domain-containing Ser/Thr kinase n=1 Tax=Calidifontibacter indicus TaxID=419650 RepID=UPI003D72A26D
MSPVSEASIVGRVIDGRYRVTRHLADGGMGSVFVATDLRLERDIALKVMRSDLARDDAFVARFRREAHSAARLTHPNVVAVTDQGSDGHYAFLAMELVLGETLRQLIRRRGPLPVAEALGLLDPVLDGLAAAHRSGIVHRDVKPENVLISSTGQVKVTDFGLARAVSTSTLTGDSDILLGTASYLSPEQVEHGMADARSDVYSAGLLLFEMVTGEKAFPGDSPIHVAYQHVHGTMPKASDAVPTVPAAVDRLIAEATAKNPDDRPATAADLLIALRTVRRSLGASRTDDDTTDAATDVAMVADADHAPTADSTDGTADTDETDETDVRSLEAKNSYTTEIGSRTDPLHTDAYPESAAAPGRRRRTVLIAAVLAVLLIVGGGAGWAFTAGPFGSTKVPMVTGMTQGSAVTSLTGSDLKVKVKQTFSETVPAGRVIKADPAAGAQTRKNSTVVLTVSKGAERFTVPGLPGTTEADARAAVAKAELTVGTVTKAYNETVPSGSVVSSNPVAGSPLKRGTKVDLVVSQGKQPIPIPVIAGQPQDQVESSLTSLGLKVTQAPQEFSDTVAKGSVIRSNPGQGAIAHKGDTVEIVVSKGPELVTVPNVVDMKSGAARSKLEAAGFTVKIDRFFGGLFDTVRDQSLRSGSSVRKGSTITLSVV